MSDFLQQLRAGNNKRFEKGRRSYDGNAYRNGDRTGSRDRKASTKRRPPDAEQLQAIRGILQSMAEAHKNLGERQAQAMERQADAMDLIANYLGRMMTHLPSPPAAGTGEEAVSGSETAESGEAEASDPASPVREAYDRKGLLQTIRERREIGESFSDIAKHLNHRQVPTVTGKGQWRAQSVSRLYGQVG